MEISSDPPEKRSLHVRIRRDVEHQIMSGALKPGDRIPFEHELMAQYGCSRMTVNKALSELVNVRLIERRRRAGSFVAKQHIDMTALSIPDIRAEIEGRGAHYGIELLARSVVQRSDAVGTEMAVRRGTPILSLICRHLADRRPFAIEHRLINLSAVPEAEAVDFGSIAPGSWLLAHVPWTEAENRIYARLAQEDARLLDIDAHAPCLGLDRRTWRSKMQITYVRQAFPAAGFNLVARFHAATA